jgi:hypothetical protein
MLYTVVNHVSSSVTKDPEPWKFQPTETITDEMRADKSLRQSWYRNEETQHNFYNGFEGVNDVQRISKENNPPQLCWALVVDCDLRGITKAQVVKIVESFKFKPAWLCWSLGGGVHFTWLFEEPMRLDGDWKFTLHMLECFKKWLRIDQKLPEFDEQTFMAPSKYYCNGCNWEPTGYGVIDKQSLRVFGFDAVKSYRRSVHPDVLIPLEVVEAELRKKFKFDWPGEFVVGSQGPSFWIPESASPLSAIVHVDGIYSFSAHATKKFYPWADLIGPEFVSKYTKNKIAEAVGGIFYDGKTYWVCRDSGLWVSIDRHNMSLELRTKHRLNPTKGKGGMPSSLDNAMQYINEKNYVENALPCPNFKPGLITVQRTVILNVSNVRPVQPAEGKFIWEDLGVWRKLLENIFDPANQLDHYLAWWKYAYEGALLWKPKPGAAMTLIGGTGLGKSAAGQAGVGASLGGWADGSKMLVDSNNNFTAEFFKMPVLNLDDDIGIVGNSQSPKMLMAQIKKLVSSNGQVRFNEKHLKSGSSFWYGRIHASFNPGPAACALLTPLDSSQLDKIYMLKGRDKSEIKFPSRDEMEKILEAELPKLLAFLKSWVVPNHVERDPRFGYKPIQDPHLMASSLNHSSAGMLKDIIKHTLKQWFVDHSDHKLLCVTPTQLLTLIAGSHPLGDTVAKKNQGVFLRDLEYVKQSGTFEIRFSPSPSNKLTFFRHDFEDTEIHTAGTESIPRTGGALSQAGDGGSAGSTGNG